MQKITLQELKSTPLFWSRLGFGYDPPMKDENGKPLLLFNNFEELQRYHADFQKAGITTHTSILHSGWMDIDTYDYSLTDRTLDALFSVSDDIFYIPRIKLNSPITWCKAYPEEVFCYHESPRTKEEIRAIVGTLSQDILGYEAKNGYYAPGFHDPRPKLAEHDLHGAVHRRAGGADRVSDPPSPCEQSLLVGARPDRCDHCGLPDGERDPGADPAHCG